MFSAAEGMHVHDFLEHLHQRLQFDWYLEAGNKGGTVLAMSRSRTIAVNPKFRLAFDPATKEPDLHLFQMTGDAFFAGDALLQLLAQPSFTFLAGACLFEQHLRNFMNVEAAGTSRSVVAIQNCCPINHPMATREPVGIKRRAWAGDVWKLLPILRDYRSDLIVEVLSCSPTGLVVISGLDPGNRVLRDNYDKILSDYLDLSLADFGLENFFGSFRFADPVGIIEGGLQTFLPACKTDSRAEESLPKAMETTAATRTRAGKLSSNGVDYYFTHPILRDVARDLSKCISSPLPGGVDVYVGVHTFDKPFDTGRLRVGIQTEHFLDRTGQRMWKCPREAARLRYASNFDVLLDFSPDNAPAYDFLPADLIAKVRFGPFIFPEAPVLPDVRSAPALFIGAVNGRRKALLETVEARRPIGVVPRGTFGRRLDTLLAQHCAVVNLHFQEGQYTEYPRFLKAYLSGKPIISEPLSPPLFAGKHYFDLDSDLSPAKVSEVFDNLAEVARTFAFRGFLESAIASASTKVET